MASRFDRNIHQVMSPHGERQLTLHEDKEKATQQVQSLKSAAVKQFIKSKQDIKFVIDSDQSSWNHVLHLAGLPPVPDELEQPGRAPEFDTDDEEIIVDNAERPYYYKVAARDDLQREERRRHYDDYSDREATFDTADESTQEFVYLPFEHEDWYFSDVYLTGSFNNWRTRDKDLRMRTNDGGKSYTVTCQLPPGLIEFKFILVMEDEDKWTTANHLPKCTDKDGNVNNYRMVDALSPLYKPYKSPTVKQTTRPPAKYRADEFRASASLDYSTPALQSLGRHGTAVQQVPMQSRIYQRVAKRMTEDQAIDYLQLDSQLFTVVRDQLSYLQRRECAQMIPECLSEQYSSGRRIIQALNMIVATRVTEVDYMTEERAWMRMSPLQPKESIRKYKDKVTHALNRYVTAGGMVSEAQFYAFIYERVCHVPVYAQVVREAKTDARRTDPSKPYPTMAAIWTGLMQEERWTNMSRMSTIGHHHQNQVHQVNQVCQVIDEKQENQKTKIQSRRKCKMFHHGNCTNKKCSFKHEKFSEDELRKMKKYPCPRMRKNGTCEFGDKCLYSHNVQANANKVKEKHPSEVKPKPANYNLENFDFENVPTVETEGVYAVNDVTTPTTTDFLIDTGASNTFVKSAFYFTTYLPVTTTVSTAAGTATTAGVGTAEIPMMDSLGEVVYVRIKNARHAPTFSSNLLGWCTLNGTLLLTHARNEMQIKDKHGKMVNVPIQKNNNMYVVKVPDATQESAYAASSSANLHRRFGHINEDAIRKIINADAVEDLPKSSKSSGKDCGACAVAKTKRVEAPRHLATTSNVPGEKLHADIFGPVKPKSVHGHTHGQVIVDSHTSYVRVDALQRKGQAPDVLKDSITYAKKTFGHKVNTIMTDSEALYQSKDLQKWMQQNGVHQMFSPPETQAKNGKAEKAVDTITKLSTTLLVDARLPEIYWPYAVQKAAESANLLMHDDKCTRQEAYTGIKPSSNKIHSFGAAAFMHSAEKQTKFSPQATPGIYLCRARATDACLVLRLSDLKIVTTAQVRMRDHLWYEDDLIKGAFKTRVESFSSLPRTLQMQTDLPNRKLPRDLLLPPHVDATATDGEGVGEEVTETESTGTTTDADDEDATLAPGTRVKAPWLDNKKYTGTVVSTNEPVVRVKWDDGAPSTLVDYVKVEPIKTIREENEHLELQGTTDAYHNNKRRTRHQARIQSSSAHCLTPEEVLHVQHYETKYKEQVHEVKEQVRQEKALINGGYSASEINPKVWTYKDFMSVINGPHGEEWRAACKKELAAVHDFGSIKLVPYDPTLNPIRMHWVLKIKIKPDGTLDKFKGRIVPAGNEQRFGIHYFNHKYPILSAAGLTLLFNVAVHNNLLVYSADTTNAFPQAELKEPTYTTLPHGFEMLINEEILQKYGQEHGDKKPMIKVTRSLYGLCQSGYNYVTRHRERLLHLGFKYSEADPCLFYLRKGAHTMWIGAFVDDEIHATVHENTRKVYLQKVNEIQPIQDLGITSAFVGMRVCQHEGKIEVDLENYILSATVDFDLHQDEGIYKSRTYHVPCTPDILDIPISAEEAEPGLKKKYERIMGVLSYAAFRLRDDVKVATSMLAQHLSKPTETLYQKAKIVLKYLVDTASLKCVYNKEQGMILRAYSAASFANHSHTRRSLGGHVLMIGSNKVMTSCRLQKTISLSSAESEYIELAETVKDVLHVRKMLKNMGYEQKGPTTIHVDNTTAEAWASTDMLYIPRRKHIDISFKWLESVRAKGQVHFVHVNGQDNIADFLSKPLPKRSFISQRSSYLQ